MSVTTRTIAAFAMPASLCLVFGIEAKMQECVVMLARSKDDVPAPPSVPAAWTTARNELLAAKREAAVPAVAGFDLDLNFVDEHGNERESKTGGNKRRKREGEKGPSTRRPALDQAIDELTLDEHVYVLAKPASITELNRAGDFCKQRVVFSKPNIFAWLVSCAALTHDDGAAADEFARKYFYAKPLRIGIAAVL